MPCGFIDLFKNVYLFLEWEGRQDQFIMITKTWCQLKITFLTIHLTSALSHKRFQSAVGMP